jgi:selenocysteine lyase/cysteine desulfurase
MSIAPDPGVVRVSAVHYNTIEEADRVCDVLEQAILAGV